KDLSYREKGKQLGRSSYKAWELISPYENHQPKITQVAELDKRIAELNTKVNELSKVTDDLSAQLKGVKTIRDLSERTSRIDEQLRGVLDSIDLIGFGALQKVSDTEYGCKKVDKDGFCIKWDWTPKLEGRTMKQVNSGDKVVNYLNVKEYPLACAACSYFEQRGKSKTET
ncbi:MAG: hypothetical protein ABSB40_04270, partial [Nitrososphaeria archaeon]